MFNIFSKSSNQTSSRAKTTFSLIDEPVVLKMADVIQTNQINRSVAIAEQRYRDGGVDYHVVEENGEFEVVNDFQLKVRKLTPKYTAGKGFNFI